MQKPQKKPVLKIKGGTYIIKNYDATMQSGGFPVSLQGLTHKSLLSGKTPTLINSRETVNNMNNFKFPNQKHVYPSRQLATDKFISEEAMKKLFKHTYPSSSADPTIYKVSKRKVVKEECRPHTKFVAGPRRRQPFFEPKTVHVVPLPSWLKTPESHIKVDHSYSIINSLAGYDNSDAAAAAVDTGVNNDTADDGVSVSELCTEKTQPWKILNSFSMRGLTGEEFENLPALASSLQDCLTGDRSEIAHSHLRWAGHNPCLYTQTSASDQCEMTGNNSIDAADTLEGAVSSLEQVDVDQTSHCYEKELQSDHVMEYDKNTNMYSGLDDYSISLSVDWQNTATQTDQGPTCMDEIWDHDYHGQDSCQVSSCEVEEDLLVEMAKYGYIHLNSDNINIADDCKDDLLYDETDVAAIVEVGIDAYDEMVNALRTSDLKPFVFMKGNPLTLVELYERAIKACIVIDRDLIMKLYIHNKQVNHTHPIFHRFPPLFRKASVVINFIRTISMCHICIGNPEPHHMSYVLDNPQIFDVKNVPIAYKEEDFGATKGSFVYNGTVRAIGCDLIQYVLQRDRCSACTRIRANLRCREFRKKNNEEIKYSSLLHSQRSNISMGRNLLIQKLDEQKEVIKQLQKKMYRYKTKLRSEGLLKEFQAAEAALSDQKTERAKQDGITNEGESDKMLVWTGSDAEMEENNNSEDSGS